MSQNNTLKVRTLFILASIFFATTSSFANVCGNFLSDINNNESLILHDRDIKIVKNESLTAYQRMILDKEFIDQITAVLIQDRSAIQKMSAPIFTETESESSSVISKLAVDVFLRYQDYAERELALGNKPLEAFTVNNELAQAILIFNNHDNPNRAKHAIQYVKAKISPRDQYKSSAVLLNLVDFYWDAGLSIEAGRVGAVYRSSFGIKDR